MPHRCRVAIVGAGIGGLALAIGLRHDGMDDFVILERSDGIGGTWRHNTYPGAACDVPSHLYSFSFAPNPDWSRAYAGQREILAYLERCADEADLRSHLRVDWPVAAATWDDQALRWTLTSRSGATVEADVVVFATGMFDEPRRPAIDGIATFAGPILHSARWDHDVDLAGSRVGVIGTGASGIQIIPEIARIATHTTVFQRTAPYVLPRHDPEFSPSARARFATDPEALALLRRELHQRYEDTTLYVVGDPVAEIVTTLALEHLATTVTDATLRAQLTPTYELGCNRTLVSSELYPALQRDDVTLVTERIVEVEPDGVTTGDGHRHRLDALVLATGFKAGEYLHGIEVTGAEGLRLHDVWADAPRAYLDMTVSGFPNLFVFYGPNTNQGGNSIILILEAQAGYVRDALATMARQHLGAVDVRPEVLEAYDDETQAAMAATVWTSGCNSYFTDARGRVVTQLPHTSGWYAERTARFELADYEGVPER